MNLKELNEFTRGYITAALWTFDEDAPSGDYEQTGRADALFGQLAPVTLLMMKGQADTFQSLYGHLWRSGSLLTDSQAGHDFWLTRSGHGSGYWDRGIGESGEQLTKLAKECGSQDLYRGDDGKIYIQ